MSKKKSQPKEELFGSESKTKKYWVGNVYIQGVGLVNGEAKPEDIAAFTESCNPETDLDDWLKDEDLLEKQLKEQRRRGVS
jgi:hypothetical protein